MSLEERVKEFARQARIALMGKVEDDKNVDTKQAIFEGFDSDGNPLIKVDGQTQKADGLGSTYNIIGQKVIYDDKNSYDYRNRREEKTPQKEEIIKPLASSPALSVKNRKPRGTIRTPLGGIDAFEHEIHVIKGAQGGEIVCIAVIDEDSNQLQSTLDAQWVSFREQYPLRPFYLLRPVPQTDALKRPAGFDADERAFFHEVGRDGEGGSISDWFEIAELGTSETTRRVILFIDQSGSMNISTVQGSYDLFKQKCNFNGNLVRGVSDTTEQYLSPFFVTDDFMDNLSESTFP